MNYMAIFEGVLDVVSGTPFLLALVTLEEIAGVDLVFHIIEAGVIAVCDDALALLFEGFEIVYNQAAEEGFAIL